MRIAHASTAAATALAVVALFSAGARAQTLTDVVVPPVGSLGRISGTVAGLVGPGPFQICIYKDSRTSTLWGPITAPISAADGAFALENWGANLWWDSLSPRFFVFAAPASYTCPLSEGLMDLPPSIYAAGGSVARGIYTRVDPMRVAMTAVPLLGTTTAAITARVTGMPEAAGTYAAVVYLLSDAGFLVGPLGGCSGGAAAAHALVAGAAAGTATVSIGDWASSPGAEASVGFMLAVIPAAYTAVAWEASTCLNATSGALAIPAALPVVTSAYGSRELPPSATPSRPPSGSASPPVTRTPELLGDVDAQGTPTPDPTLPAADSAAGVPARMAAAAALLVAVAVGAAAGLGC